MSKNDLLQQQEETFGDNAQERIIGLLGAMIPTFAVEKKEELKGSIFLSEEFLFLLFIIAFGDSGHELPTQHLAMGLLGHLLVRASPTVTDAAMSSTRDPALDGEDTQDLSTSQVLTKLSDRISKSS